MGGGPTPLGYVLACTIKKRREGICGLARCRGPDGTARLLPPGTRPSEAVWPLASRRASNRRHSRRRGRAAPRLPRAGGMGRRLLGGARTPLRRSPPAARPGPQAARAPVTPFAAASPLLSPPWQGHVPPGMPRRPPAQAGAASVWRGRTRLSRCPVNTVNPSALVCCPFPFRLFCVVSNPYLV